MTRFTVIPATVQLGAAASGLVATVAAWRRGVLGDRIVAGPDSRVDVLRPRRAWSRSPGESADVQADRDRWQPAGKATTDREVTRIRRSSVRRPGAASRPGRRRTVCRLPR